jgi:small-conductance mechanosensitive channel/CRP-like cAMP-binding protein
LLLAFTFDRIFRYLVKRINHHKKQGQIPVIVVEAGSILIYSLVSLLGFILLFDQSISTLVAASGALGLAIGYAFRDLIADVVASITLQTDHLISIGDVIEYVEGGSTLIAKVAEMDRRYVMLRNLDGASYRITNNRFLGINFVNLSQQERLPIREVSIVVDAQYNSDRVLSVLDSAMEFVGRDHPQFSGWYRCFVSQVQIGNVTYKIRFECRADSHLDEPRHYILKNALRFLKSSGITFDSSMVVQNVESLHTSHFSPLLNVYPFGILRVLSETEILELSKNTKSLHFNPGQQIIQQGDNADSMYIIAEGCLEVTSHNEKGDRITLAHLWPGDCVGEMSLLTGEPRSANVFAILNTHLIEITKEEMAPILAKNPLLVERISNLLAERTTHKQKTLNLSSEDKFVQEVKTSLVSKILNFFSKL